mgnify:CR=1 FL=1
MERVIRFIAENSAEMLEQTGEHIALTVIALFFAVLIGLPLGILVTRYSKLEKTVLGSVGVIQTIPSIALLGILLPIFGIGVLPAVIALFLYALLPIVRNVYSGIEGVESSVIESARGMGMTSGQILRKIELPLSVPVILAGIRTATGINGGVATLGALIGAGGLGEFIFRGIALNNVEMILAGALPAAALALLFDFILGLIQKNIKTIFKPLLYSLGVLTLFAMIFGYFYSESSRSGAFRAGMPTEFMQRSDGYKALRQHYDFDMPTLEMNQALMYQALQNGRVDVIGGYSTDGRIEAYDLKVLEDDRSFFPPYSAAPLVHSETLREYPEIEDALNRLGVILSNAEMGELIFRVDENGEDPRAVARDFLESKGFRTSVERDGSDILIGGKNFTEHFILAEMFDIVIENYTSLAAGTRLGLAGTQIVFGALQNREIDLYPEYTGTGLYVLLQAGESVADSLGNNREAVYNYVKKETEKRFDAVWLESLGFQNTYALMMRKEQAAQLNIQTISDMVEFLKKPSVPLEER